MSWIVVWRNAPQFDWHDKAFPTKAEAEQHIVNLEWNAPEASETVQLFERTGE